jgi:hypothetical protein
MLVRKLTEEDGEALWVLRLRALTDNPEAFATTYEETLASGRERLLEGLRQEESFYVGAFEHGLIGMVYFRREEGLKNRHNPLPPGSSGPFALRPYRPCDPPR